MSSGMRPEGKPALEALCPEINYAEGSAVSIERIASSLGLMLDGFTECVGGVRLAATHGFASILVGGEERIFLVGIYKSEIEWASGATPILGSALKAVAAWRGGISLELFVSGFPFMEPGVLAYSHERGNVTQAKWESLLNSDYSSSCKPLLVQLYKYDGLRKLFPDISYGEIRFTMPPPQRESRVIFVLEGGDGYSLQGVGSEPREYSVASLNKVARIVSEYLIFD